MKANEAPEKLYFDVNNNLIGLYDSAILGMFSAKNTETSIEYTRTDAFIEKVEKAMIEWAGTYISKTTGGGVGERKALATDLLNYFKKYMEGE